MFPIFRSKIPVRRSGCSKIRLRWLCAETLERRNLLAYNFESFDVPIGIDTRAYGINDLGQIVGYHSDSRRFLKDGGAFSEIHAASLGAASSFAFGINNSGQITGMYRRPDTSFHQHGFLLSSTGYEEITAPGATDTSANSVNDSGQIVGQFSLPNLPDDLGRGFVKTGATYEVIHATSIGAARVTSSLGINNQGDVVGWFIDSSELIHGFLKNSAGYSAINFPGVASGTYAYGINTPGEIVGGYNDAFGQTHGFVKTNAGFESIDYPGAVRTEAYDINTAGTIVGTYRDSSGRFHGFLATKMTSVNQPPVSNANGSYNVAEGGSVVVSSAGSSDPDGTIVDYNWDFNYDGVNFQPDVNGASPIFSAASLDGTSTQTIALRVTDDQGAATVDTTTVVVNNVAPTVEAIMAPIAPVTATTMINVSANFTDPGVLDSHTAEWDWGDENTSAGTVSETNGSGAVTGNHAYSAPGVYTVELTVTDDDTGVGTSLFQYVVVYDPSAGFVTGGGWINSPAGADAGNPTLTGKANFGFVAKYKKGADTPEGNTEFQFKAGDFNFRSVDYQWLVVAGENAKFKGTGTVNGQPGFEFMITAHDGQVQGADGIDKFRIKVWNAEGVVYDNQLGQSDDSQAATALGGGSIVIHKGGNSLVLAAAANGAPSGAPRLDDDQLSTAVVDVVDQVLADWTLDADGASDPIEYSTSGTVDDLLDRKELFGESVDSLDHDLLADLRDWAQTYRIQNWRAGD